MTICESIFADDETLQSLGKDNQVYCQCVYEKISNEYSETQFDSLPLPNVEDLLNNANSRCLEDQKI